MTGLPPGPFTLVDGPVFGEIRDANGDLVGLVPTRVSARLFVESRALYDASKALLGPSEIEPGLDALREVVERIEKE